MKILFLSNTIGALRSFRYEFIEKLCKNGNEVIISSPLESSPKCFEDMGCKIVPAEFTQRGMNPIKEFKIISHYKKVLKHYRPDIVLAYTIKPNVYGSIACRSLGIPIIASVTGLGTAVENGGVLQKITVALYKWGFKKTDFVYFQNKESMDFFDNHNIRLLSKSLIAGSGVNLKKFALTDYPTIDDGIHFLFISRILEAKGIGQYLSAAKYFYDKGENVHFHIVGIKDDEKYSNMIQEMHDKGIVEFHGQQSDVRPFIASAHCLVHPSYYPEGMSNVLLESAAMGRPAITTDKSGCKEVVDNGITGYIVKQKDSEDLIAKIQMFLDLSYEQKKSMGIAANEKVSTYFNREKIIESYSMKIRELVPNKILK